MTKIAFPAFIAATETTISAVSGQRVPLDGVWSGCAFPTPAVPGGSIQESFTIDDGSIEISIAMYASTDCSGPVVGTDQVNLSFALGESSRAELAGRTVFVTRVEGTDLDDGTPFKQVFHVDDTGAADRLFHGVFAGDGGAVDAGGYPIVLHEASLERRVTW